MKITKHSFPATMILHEISSGHIEAPKTAILTVLAALNVEFLKFLTNFKPEIFSKYQNSKPLKCQKFQKFKIQSC